MEFCGMKREIDRKCLNHAHVHASAQSFDRCGGQRFTAVKRLGIRVNTAPRETNDNYRDKNTSLHVSLRKRKFDKKIHYCCRNSFFVEKDI